MGGLAGGLAGVDVYKRQVPKDAAALILAGPTVDYTAEDVQLLRDYLDGGGSLLVFTDASAATPNLDALLAEYGLARTPGLVVEGDANHHARGLSLIHI